MSLQLRSTVFHIKIQSDSLILQFGCMQHHCSASINIITITWPSEGNWQSNQLKWLVHWLLDR